MTPEGEIRSDEPKLLTSYLLFLAAALVLVLGFAAPTFRVSHISVVGHNLPVGAIADASGAQGRNIFTIRGATIVHSLEQVPDVIVTGVSISLPNTVIVRATERAPVFAWNERGSLFEVDQYGRLISRVRSARLPLVRNYATKRYSLGDYISPTVTLGVVYAIRSLKNARTTSFDIGQYRGIVIHSSEGWRAVLGLPSPRELVVRIATLQSFINKNRNRLLRSVDLRSRSPFARYAP
jgi:hypothetical protein